MKNLIKAVNQVMAEVKGIEKNLNVGSGSYSYKGVADKDVKKQIGEAMQKAGLAIFPTGIETEEQQNGKAVRVSVKTKYTLIHESGESIELMGYGHGVDTMDKAPGKATTYALKYALLYTFMVPTGDIDDTDTTHSNETKAAPKKQTKTEEIEIVELENIDIAKIRATKTHEGLEAICRQLTKTYNKASIAPHYRKQRDKLTDEMVDSVVDVDTVH